MATIMQIILKYIFNFYPCISDVTDSTVLYLTKVSPSIVYTHKNEYSKAENYYSQEYELFEL